jgi:hypothetical protein
LTRSDRADVISAWKTTIPSLSLKHLYLKHGLLSLAAMHLHHQCSPEARPFYFELASLHQDKALEYFIPQLEVITEETCHALFAFSILLPALQYSFLTVPRELHSSQDLIDRIIINFDYLIGATVISSGADEWIVNGIVAPLVTIRKLESIIPDLIQEPQNSINALMYSISQSSTLNNNHTLQSKSHTENATLLSIYKHSIDMLSNAFPSADSNRRYLDATIGWPYFVGLDFLGLLKENDPIALVILGFYGVALHSFKSFWWLDRMGARLVEAVSHVISPTHLPLLQWPLAMISSN